MPASQLTKLSDTGIFLFYRSPFITIGLLLRLLPHHITLLTVAKTLTLHTDIIAEHRSKDEIFFWRKLIERSCDHKAYGFKALLSPEKEI